MTHLIKNSTEKNSTEKNSNIVQEKDYLENKMKEIANYCVVDSQRCLELFRKRNVIPDKRELANLTFTSIYDAFYRAGGMKIRNVVISEGQDRGYVFSNKSKSIKDMNKFPGAKVLNPKTGLYNPKLTLRERMEKHSEFIKKFSMLTGILFIILAIFTFSLAKSELASMAV